MSTLGKWGSFMNVRQVRYGSPDVTYQFATSLRETGFAVLSHHPVPATLISDTFAEWSDFFAGSEKSQYTYDPKTQAGYFPFKTENAKGYSQKDLKEFFHLYPQTALPKGMSPLTWTMFREMSTLAGELLSWVQEYTPTSIRDQYSMPLPEMIKDSQQILLRILHYPPLQGVEAPGEVRAAAHEDINLITLLPAATAPGLQVKAATGEWLDVPCDPGSIVINAGDMLQEASQQFFKSTTHQVVNPVGEGASKSRYSMPLFLHPRPDVRLSPNYLAHEYLNQRLREIGLKS
jgi:isopenicillin N synthase-like dioxygenase